VFGVVLLVVHYFILILAIAVYAQATNVLQLTTKCLFAAD